MILKLRHDLNLQSQVARLRCSWRPQTMSWISITLTVDGKQKLRNAVQKVAKGLTFGTLAHQLTNNEHVGDETVKLSVTITHRVCRHSSLY